MDCIQQDFKNEQAVTEEEPVHQEIRRKVIITGYCNEKYPHICNNGDFNNTATMTIPTPGRTIAVDPSVIPYNTNVFIPGVGNRVAEDCGGAIKGNRVDILFNTHQEALEFGIKEVEIIIYE